eukprot:SAG11_NODE_447_length_9395_cov_4.121665_2_plen_62_part_00
MLLVDVDRRPIVISVGVLLVYLLVGLMFYTQYMSTPLEGELMERIQGAYGDWDWLNTMGES